MAETPKRPSLRERVTGEVPYDGDRLTRERDERNRIAEKAYQDANAIVATKGDILEQNISALYRVVEAYRAERVARMKLAGEIKMLDASAIQMLRTLFPEVLEDANDER